MRRVQRRRELWKWRQRLRTFLILRRAVSAGLVWTRSGRPGLGGMGSHAGGGGAHPCCGRAGFRKTGGHDGLQIRCHLSGAGVAVSRQIPGGAADDGVEARVTAHDGGCRARILGWQPTREQFMEHDTHRKDVRAVADGVGRSSNFRRSVVRGAVNFIALPHLNVVGTGEPEVADLRLGVEIEQDVRRFDVAVDDSIFVGVGESPTDAGNEAHGFHGIDGDAVGGVMDRLARHELHDEVEHSADLAKVIHADEIGMIEAGHGLGFRLEASSEGCIRTELGRQDFNRHRAIQRPLGRAIDGPHAAGGDEGFDVIAGK